MSIHSEDPINIINAHEHNLKNITLSIPKNQIVVFTGVSGSGKSSLVFDTLAVESQRQWQASYSQYIRNKMPHYTRPQVDQIKNLTPAIVIRQRATTPSGRSTVGTIVDAAPLLRLLFSRIGHPSAGGSMAYSLNHPAGMCPVCTGLGKRQELNADSLFDTTKSLAEGAIIFSQFSSGWQSTLYTDNGILDPNKQLRDFTPAEWRFLRDGPQEERKIEIRSNTSGRVDQVAYEGVIPRFKRLYLNRDIGKLAKKLRTEITQHITTVPCTACQGTGLNAKALASKINDHNIIDMMRLTVEQLLTVLTDITDPRGISLVNQLTTTLQRMVDIGIGYLPLVRPANTLSGGELQRLKIVRNLGGSLNNITYIFDEPTTGLHPADIRKIGTMLQQLRDAHNNVLVVEHATQIMHIADMIIDIGPLAGDHGGEISYQGSVANIQQLPTPTGQALRRQLTMNSTPLPWQDSYLVTDAHQHNLKHLNITIPKHVLTAVTGVAGSGKSTLVSQEFVAQYPDTITINQQPIGTSIRSTPATYTGVMDDIRKLFGQANGVSPSWFSFNAKGACPICHGKGVIKYDMAFADAVEVTCEACQGRRYNPQALSYRFQGKTIEQVLNLTIEQALDFFNTPKITDKLTGLTNVGLDYLTLGQPTSTLSGGETQRIKIAAELQKQGATYVLDEPSAGLHPHDVQVLRRLLRQLVANQNTVILIEHNLDLISQADWVIDLGPHGGERGGYLNFAGTPADLLTCQNSLTAKYLRLATN